MQINVPENGATTLIARDGKIYRATQAPDGRIVLDVPPAEFFALLQGRDGLRWKSVNDDACRELTQYRFATT